MRVRNRAFVPVIVALLVTVGFLATSASRPHEVEAQIPPIALNALCVHSYTHSVSAPTPLTGTTCPALHYTLLIPDSFPFTLSVNPATGLLLHAIPPPANYATIVLPDAGNVPLCLNLFTKRLSRPPTGNCPAGSLNLVIVGQRAPNAVDDGLYTLLVNGNLNEPAPGLLANDDLGLPAAPIVSFGGGDLGGDATSFAAGTTLIGGLAGGDLSVNADGSFTLTTPTIPGDYSFDYRLENAAGNDDATVTIQVQQLPSANDDSYATELNVTLEVLTSDLDDLLNNDTLGFPPASIASFGGGDLVGDASTNPAGTSVGLAGGTLTVNANGSLTLTTPTQAGTFTFDYRLTNAAGSDDATVTITIDEAPAVTATTPLDTADTVAVNTDLSITFSENVTLTGDWFEIVCATSGNYNPTGSGGATVVGVTDTDPVYTLNPSNDFASGELCTVTVFASQVADDDAVDPPDNMAANYVFSFTTDVPPTVTGTSPTDGASDVPVDSDVSVTFSEPVTTGGGWFDITCTTSGNHTAAVSGGPTSFTLNPDADFSLSEACTVTLVADQITDQDAGDPPDTLDGDEDGVSEGSTTDDVSFSFTTPDLPPQVASTLPLDTATSVDPTADLNITFTEAVDVSGDWVTITCGAETFNPTGSGGATPITVDAAGDPLYVLNPDSDLPGGANCTVTITADNVSDDDAADPPDTLDGDEDGTSEGSPTDDYVFSFGTAPLANDDNYQSLGNVGNVVNAAGGVILGAGADEGSGLSVSQVQGAGGNVGVPTATDQSGSVTLAADGSFTYDPPAGFTGDDTFTYQVTGTTGTSNTATVTITLAEMLWFIDNSASGSNLGTLTNPFTSVASFNGSGLPGTGDTIFIYTGNADYTTGVDLLDDQILIGQAAGDTIANISSLTVPAFSRALPATGGTAPVLTDAADDGVDLATNNVVHGLDIGDRNGYGLFGTEVGTLEVRDVNISGAGGGVDLGSTTAAVMDVILANLSATGVDEGVRLNGVSGSFAITATNGTLNSNGAPAVAVIGAASPNEVDLGVTFASITASGGINGMRLENASGSFTVSGAVDIDNTSGSGVLISNAPATFTFNGTTSVDGAGIHGIDLSGGNGPITFTGIDVDDITDVGLRSADLTNTLTVNGGSIGATNDPGGNAVDIQGGANTISIAASVTKTTAGEVVEVTGRGSSTVTFSGALSCNSGCTGLNVSTNTGGSTTFSSGVTTSTGANTAVDLVSNGGHTVTFSGGLDVDTTSGTGFNATGGGTVNVTGATNVVDTTAGTAVNVNAVTIGASGMTFLRVSAAGATHGIRLNTTGTGAFTITGSGTTDGSGGIIQNITQRGAEFISASNIALNNMTFTNANTVNGAVSDGTSGGNENTDENGAIHLQTATNVSLTNVDINGAVQHGVNGNLVTNLDITNSVIENTGNAVWESGVYIFQLRGTSGNSQDSVFDNTTIRDTGQFNVFVQNNGATNAAPGAMDRLVFQNCAFADSGNSVIGDHVTVANRDTANFQTVVDTCTFTAVAGQTSDSIQIDAGNTSRSDAQITGSSFVDGNLAINLSGSGTSTTTFNVSNNVSIQNLGGNGVNIASNGSASLTGTIANNPVIASTVGNNAGSGIDIVVDQTGSAVVDIDNNVISNFTNGMRGGARNAGAGSANLTIRNNTMTAGGTNAFSGLVLFSGNGSASEANTVCVNLMSNTISGGGGVGAVDYFLEQYTGNTFQLQGLTPASGASQAQVEAFVAGTDTGTPSVDALGGLIVNYTAGTCATP